MTRRENAGNAFEHAFKARNFVLQVFGAGGRELVNANTAVSGRDGPLGLKEFGLEKALESWVERALLDLQRVVGSFFDVLGEGVAVEGLNFEGAENHHFQGAGEEIALFGRLHGERAPFGNEQIRAYA